MNTVQLIDLLAMGVLLALTTLGLSLYAEDRPTDGEEN